MGLKRFALRERYDGLDLEIRDFGGGSVDGRLGILQLSRDARSVRQGYSTVAVRSPASQVCLLLITRIRALLG